MSSWLMSKWMRFLEAGSFTLMLAPRWIKWWTTQQQWRVAARSRGLRPSESSGSTLEPCSIRNLTVSRWSNMAAMWMGFCSRAFCKRREKLSVKPFRWCYTFVSWLWNVLKCLLKRLKFLTKVRKTKMKFFFPLFIFYFESL